MLLHCNPATPSSIRAFAAPTRCPHCGDPVVPATFASLALGQDFSCELGGSWTKISDSSAEMHDAAASDKPCAFKADEQVYPF